ncbi:MAG: hypothetical protein AAFP77_11455 [Bacteroidota bacterium]
MSKFKSGFQKAFAWFGIFAMAFACWQHSQRREILKDASEVTTVVVDRIYDNPGSTNRSDFRLEYSYYIAGNSFRESDRVSTVMEQSNLRFIAYPHLQGLPLTEGMDIFINYVPESPDYSKILTDTLPEASIALVQIQLENWLADRHPEPDKLVLFAYDEYGLEGLRTLFWWCRQEARLMKKEEKQHWDIMQAAFEKENETSPQ